MIIKNIFILTFILFFAYIGNAIVIKGLASSENGAGSIYNKLSNEFNDYATKNNIDVKLEINLLSKDNSTVEVTDYESTLDTLFSKNTEKYEIFFYDNIFTTKYGKHFVNLKEVISKEHFELFENGIAPQSCVYEDNWVALPITIDLAVLYYNQNILNKYNKDVPKTWNELIETAKYILEEEKKLNNDDIIGYNGLFDDEEMGTCSLYEFIYTFRDKKDSPYPSFNSKEVENALKTMKRIKEEISSDEIFKKDLYFAINSLDVNNIFSKTWYVPHMTDSKFTLIPGNKEGISGSVIGGFNVAINKYSSIDKQKDAAIIVEFITSMEIQKKMVLSDKIFSAIPSVYDDEEVCAVVDCEIFKNVQLITRPSSKQYDYSTFSSKFRKAIYEYLYGDKSVKDAMKNVQKIVDEFESSYIKKSYYGLFIYFIVYFTYYLIINF